MILKHISYKFRTNFVSCKNARSSSWKTSEARLRFRRKPKDPEGARRGAARESICVSASVGGLKPASRSRNQITAESVIIDDEIIKEKEHN